MEEEEERGYRTLEGCCEGSMYGGAVGVPEGWALGLDIGCFDGRHSGCRLGPTYIHTQIYISTMSAAPLSHTVC